MNSNENSAIEVDLRYERLMNDATSSGYHLNPDIEFTKGLIDGLLTNEKRYGYVSCPCRLAAGAKDEDMDIICPCEYRDADLNDYGACYCALYVSEAILKGEKELSYVPERRLPPQDPEKKGPAFSPSSTGNLAYPVWRCKICGYLCAREYAPEICPICKSKKERFEQFI